MAPGAKPWPVLPAATLLLLAVILMAKHTAVAADDPTTGDLIDIPCSGSHLPDSCTAVLNSCHAAGFLNPGGDCASLFGANFAEACCRDLTKMKVVDDHRCAKCALLKEFDGTIDLTKSCTNGVNFAAAACKEQCDANPNDAECKFP